MAYVPGPPQIPKFSSCTLSPDLFQYCRHQNPQMMEDLYYQEDNFLEEANCKVVKSFDDEQTDEQMKLLKYQRRMEEEFNRPYMDLSLHQTIYRLIMESSHKPAEQLRKEFKVPERRYWWLRMHALGEAGEWAELERFSKSKKPPVGLEAFVEVCSKHKNVAEAMKYIARVQPDQKVKCLLKIGQKKSAAEAAFENHSEEELNLVLQKCGAADKQLVENIRSMKQQLGGRR